MSARAVKSSRTTNSMAYNFAILNGLVDETGIEPATSSLRTGNH